jgi:hypothetical protein
LVQEHAASFIAHTEASTGSELPQFIKAEPGHKQERVRILACNYILPPAKRCTAT